MDGETLRGSRTADTTARHVLAASDQATGIMLASTDVHGKTNEITRFASLLDQIGDLRDVVITADVCTANVSMSLTWPNVAQWILTVKGNQPALHTH
ncbi:hypothetical protein O7626_38660 [Micromonospora sp. WMMD1102]|uniref:hypothetical protein n=1 Tax=Micromonospora sp. WMMD1102 TaxID=3016105 RepID=UPI0024154445|nr:hypothetical protein [Micromonospora sp. WMMD1102]MDG4791747.1 hypothetical protein [Micromonospora sp. WMMD1102]